MAAKSKSVLFTLASARDSEPTVTATRLGLQEFKGRTPEFVKITLRSKHAKANGSTYEVRFRLNRLRKNGSGTYIAIDWPNKLSKPTVGNPVEAKVESIKVLY